MTNQVFASPRDHLDRLSYMYMHPNNAMHKPMIFQCDELSQNDGATDVGCLRILAVDVVWSKTSTASV